MHLLALPSFEPLCVDLYAEVTFNLHGKEPHMPATSTESTRINLSTSPEAKALIERLASNPGASGAL